jgi:hypothetical protein
MSYNTMAAQYQDRAFRDRVNACVQQEQRTGTHPPIDAGTEVLDDFVWAVTDATEDAYASALAAGVDNPGGDEAVVTDEAILAAVQAAWPAT